MLRSRLSNITVSHNSDFFLGLLQTEVPASLSGYSHTDSSGPHVSFHSMAQCCLRPNLSVGHSSKDLPKASCPLAHSGKEGQDQGPQWCQRQVILFILAPSSEQWWYKEETDKEPGALGTAALYEASACGRLCLLKETGPVPNTLISPLLLFPLTSFLNTFLKNYSPSCIILFLCVLPFPCPGFFSTKAMLRNGPQM